MFTQDKIDLLTSIHHDASANVARLKNLIETHGESTARVQAITRNLVTSQAAAMALMCAQAGISLDEARQLLSLPSVLGAPAATEPPSIAEMVARLDEESPQ